MESILGGVERCSLAHVPQPTEQVPSRRKVPWHVHEQTHCLGANLGPITSLIRSPEQPDIHAKVVVILPSTQFSPARQVLLAGVHATRTDYLYQSRPDPP